MMRPGSTAASGLMADVSGPGMVPLEQFLQARFDEQEPGAVDPDVLGAHRRVLAAFRSARYGTMHRVGLQAAVKALASIWAEHSDYDPTWRS